MASLAPFYRLVKHYSQEQQAWRPSRRIWSPEGGEGMEMDFGIEPEFDPELYGVDRKPQPEQKGLNQKVNFVYVLLAITVAALLCFQLLPQFMGL